MKACVYIYLEREGKRLTLFHWINTHTHTHTEYRERKLRRYIRKKGNVKEGDSFGHLVVCAREERRVALFVSGAALHPETGQLRPSDHLL